MSTEADRTRRRTTPARRDRDVDTARRLAPYVLLVVGWLVAYPFTRHYGNPDGTSYAVVARLWLEGDWADAVNGYWGPLLSWLMAPLMALGVPSILALRLALLGGALFSLPPLRALCRRAGASAAATDALLLAVAPFLVYASLFGLYPDVLLAAALLRCCDYLFRPTFGTSARTALAAGAWGGVAYLAKAYAVPVVLVLLPVAVLVHLVSVRGRRVGPLLRQGAVAFVGFAVVFATWAGVLTVSYGEPTFSTSAGFNAELVAPGSAGNPFNYRGLYPPPRQGALSAWVEPSTMPIATRTGGDGDESGSSDTSALAERVESAYANARIVVGSMLRRGLPVVVLALLALGWHLRRRAAPHPAVTGTLMAGAISAGGLLLIIAIERYLWFAVLACVPAAAVGLDVALRNRRRVMPYAAVALTGVMAATSLHGLLPRWNVDQDVTAATTSLQEAGGLDGAVASTGMSWHRTLLLCLEVGCQYYGRPVAEDVETAQAELSGAGVDHLLVWDAEPGELSGLPPAEGPGVLTVYTVTPEGLVPARRVEAGSGG